LMLIQ